MPYGKIKMGKEKPKPKPKPVNPGDRPGGQPGMKPPFLRGDDRKTIMPVKPKRGM